MRHHRDPRKEVIEHKIEDYKSPPAVDNTVVRGLQIPIDITPDHLIISGTVSAHCSRLVKDANTTRTEHLGESRVVEVTYPPQSEEVSKRRILPLPLTTPCQPE